MSETDTATPEASAAASGGRTDLYSVQVEEYEAALNRGLEYAHRRFGFTVFHSLPGSRVVPLRQELGFATTEATDQYNLGIVAAENEDFATAAKQFAKALKMDPELIEAEFNLAVALAKSGDSAGAKKHLESYLKNEDLDEEERETVSQCLQELG